MKIRCFYTCHAGCGLKEQMVDVEQRVDGQDIAEWIRTVASHVIAADHRKRAPKCNTKALDIGIRTFGDDVPLGTTPFS